MNKVKYHFNLLKKEISLLLELEKKFTLYHVISSILSSLAPYINIYFMAKMVNELLYSKHKKAIACYVLLIVMLDFFIYLIVNTLNNSKKYRLQQLNKNEKIFFSEKNMSMDYCNLESNEVRSLFERINMENQGGHNLYFLYTFLGEIITNVISIVSATILTYSLFSSSAINYFLKTIIIVLILFAVIFSVITNLKTNNYMLEYFDKCMVHGAKFGFLYNFYKEYKVGKDVRLYNMRSYIVNIQKDEDAYYDQALYETQKRSLRYEVPKQIFLNVIIVFIYIVFAVSCFNGEIKIGDIAKYVACIMMMITNSSGLVSQMQSLFNNNKYFENYFSYLDLESVVVTGSEKLSENIDQIEFKMVSFKYPNSEVFALENFSFKFSYGKKYAIVGLSGSGKTTMIKLLCRLYNPTNGEILINGVNIKEYEYDEYIKKISVVFQDFKLFSFELAQNITCSEEYDLRKIKNIINNVGLSKWVNSLSNRMTTPLYKDFDEAGVEISGGEAQKIAIARAIYKNSPIIILDEPTATLDPISEAEVYSEFDKLVSGKLSIFISHRLSSCLFCDDIIVVENGNLKQNGNHKELLAEVNGLYYKMWKSQEQYYVR
jgi:ABC-type multidrug transport system, ATPase and permease components